MFDGCGNNIIPPSVTPLLGLVTSVAVGGAAVMVIPPGAYGGYIWNPLSTADQNVSPAEPLYVDPIQGPQLQGFGSTITLQPGETYFVQIVKSLNGVFVNAATSGHRFTCVYWMGP